MQKTLKFVPIYKGEFNKTPNNYKEGRMIIKSKKNKSSKVENIVSTLVLSVVVIFILAMIFFL